MMRVMRDLRERREREKEDVEIGETEEILREERVDLDDERERARERVALIKVGGEMRRERASFERCRSREGGMRGGDERDFGENDRLELSFGCGVESGSLQRSRWILGVSYESGVVEREEFWERRQGIERRDVDDEIGLRNDWRAREREREMMRREREEMPSCEREMMRMREEREMIVEGDAERERERERGTRGVIMIEGGVERER
ncbi:hypothetical protein Tco_0003330 [Tanacetum coccineum]